MLSPIFLCVCVSHTQQDISHCLMFQGKSSTAGWEGEGKKKKNRYNRFLARLTALTPL